MKPGWPNDHARKEERLKERLREAAQKSDREQIFAIVAQLDEQRTDKAGLARDFDPTSDDPYELIDAIFWLASATCNNDNSDLGDELRKGLQAWHYFEDTIGLDLPEISRRWSKLRMVFVPPHVAAAHGSEEIGGLFDLLNEAYTAFVFGTHGAAIAMCRALTETVLMKHYGLGEGDLKDIIVLAEKKYPWVRSLKLQDMRRLANNVLHRNEKANEEAVLAYLTTVKTLIEKAPVTES